MRRIVITLLAALLFSSCATMTKKPEVPLVFDSARPVFPALYLSVLQNGGVGFEVFDPYANEYTTAWIKTTAMNFGIQPVNIRYKLKFTVKKSDETNTVSITILNPEIQDLKTGNWRKTSLDQNTTRARFGSTIKEVMELADEQWSKTTKTLFSDPAFLHGLLTTVNQVAFNKLLEEYQIIGSDYAITVPFISASESSENSAFKFKAIGSFEPIGLEEEEFVTVLDSLLVVLFTNDDSLFVSARSDKPFEFRGTLKGLVRGDQLAPYLLIEQ